MYNIVTLTNKSAQYSPERKSGIEKYSFCAKILLSSLALLATLVSPLKSQTTGGGYAEAYLLRDVGSRATAMSGAFTAISNDPYAIFYNPAGLGFISSRPVVDMYVSSLGYGRTHTAMAWGAKINDNFGLGIGLNSMFSGSFMSRNEMGTPLGENAAFQYDLCAGAAYNLEFASMGVALKYLTNNLRGSETYGNGVAIDVGTKFNIMDLFSFGMSVQNLAGQMFWNTKNSAIEEIPWTVRTGLAVEYGLNEKQYTSRSTADGEVETVNEPATRYVLIGLDAVLRQHDVAPTFVLGVEAAAHEMIVFRGGMAVYGNKLGTPKLFPMTQWGGGVSFRPELNNVFGDLPFKTHIDYSVSNEYISQSGIVHSLSLQFEF